MVVEFETNSGIICSILSSFGCGGLLGAVVGQIFDMCTQKGLTPHTLSTSHTPPSTTACGREAVRHSGGDAAVIIVALGGDAAPQLRARANAAAVRSLHARALQ